MGVVLAGTALCGCPTAVRCGFPVGAAPPLGVAEGTVAATFAGGLGTEATWTMVGAAWWWTCGRAGCSTSTAPAVTSAAAARPAAAFVAIAPTLADRNPVVLVPITAPAPAAAVPPTAAAVPPALAPEAPEPAPAPAEWPMCRIANLRSSTNPPTGSTAVSALLVSFS
jgi:hypothetical protein